MPLPLMNPLIHEENGNEKLRNYQKKEKKGRIICDIGPHSALQVATEQMRRAMVIQRIYIVGHDITRATRTASSPSKVGTIIPCSTHPVIVFP